MENEKKYVLNGIEYKQRETKIKPYRLLSIDLLEKYEDGLPEIISKTQEKVNSSLMSDKSFMGEAISAKNNDDKEKLGNLTLKCLNKNKDLMKEYLHSTIKRRNYEEKFLLDENNSKLLCEIFFENSETINHNPDSEEDVDSYLEFLRDVLSDFFLKTNNRLLKFQK